MLAIEEGTRTNRRHQEEVKSFYRVLDHAAPASAQTYKDFRRFGWDGVVRYIAGPEAIYNWKRLTFIELRAIHDANLALYLVFQNGGDGAAYFSFAQGVKDGRDARTAAAEFGWPRDLPIFFAVDYNASDADLTGVLLAYFNGVYEGMLHADGRPAYPIGVYGSIGVLRYAQRSWPGIEHYWQTYAWSGGVRLPNCDMFQYDNGQTVAGHSVDLNEALFDGWRLGP
jgi:hypothetical protein